jgi:predicted nucleic-acid-binding Zn-ribbon protein
MTKPEEKKEKKKEPTFRKQENGMVFTSENMIAVGLPTEIETRTEAGGGVSIMGGKAKGVKEVKVKYDWRVISGSPLPPKEMEELKESIATSSHTIVASLDNATVAPVKCKKCGNSNFYGKFCSYCGNPLYS